MNISLVNRFVGALMTSLALLLVMNGSAAYAAQGTGSLFVSGATHTPTHWDIPVGVPTNAVIRGVSTSEVGNPLPATIFVYVKSSGFGNTQIVATRIDATSDYSFTYTPPSNICSTTVVSYRTLGLNANNDLLDDGLQNGTKSAACGFRFVNSAGNPIECPPLAVDRSAWGTVKNLYR